MGGGEVHCGGGGAGGGVVSANSRSHLPLSLHDVSGYIWRGERTNTDQTEVVSQFFISKGTSMELRTTAHIRRLDKMCLALSSLALMQLIGTDFFQFTLHCFLFIGVLIFTTLYGCLFDTCKFLHLLY
jgi:hypothetical protein